eukprot:6020052-Pleurochrysis_carterae.AAC.2
MRLHCVCARACVRVRVRVRVRVCVSPSRAAADCAGCRRPQRALPRHVASGGAHGRRGRAAPAADEASRTQSDETRTESR